MKCMHFNLVQNLTVDNPMNKLKSEQREKNPNKKTENWCEKYEKMRRQTFCGLCGSSYMLSNGDFVTWEHLHLEHSDNFVANSFLLSMSKFRMYALDFLRDSTISTNWIWMSEFRILCVCVFRHDFGTSAATYQADWRVKIIRLCLHNISQQKINYRLNKFDDDLATIDFGYAAVEGNMRKRIDAFVTMTL